MGDDFPLGWTKTTRDLFAESDKSGIPVGPPETDWALAYERSLLRAWARFPRFGDIFEASDDTVVDFVTHGAAPFTGGGTGTLPKGTMVRVKSSVASEPLAVYADPLQREIELDLVSEADQAAQSYQGFSLIIATAHLNRNFRLVSSVDEPSNPRLERP